MKARLFGVCLLIGLATAGCSWGRPAATPTPLQPTATATAAAAATQALPGAPATATATLADPPATDTPVPPSPATATPTVPAAATATATIASASAPTATPTTLPPTATATAAAATAAPTQAPAVPVDASKASLSINGQTIAYSYPAGWQMRQETTSGSSVVFLDGPDGALLTLTMYGVDSDPAQLSSTLLEGLKKQFSGISATPLRATVAGRAAEGYTIRFTHMGAPITGTILSFRGGKASFTLYTQAADSSMSSASAGFELVKSTLVVR